MLDDAVYFTNEQVLGGVLLKTGDLVDGIAVRDHAQGGWRALRVSALKSVATSRFLHLYLTVLEIASITISWDIRERYLSDKQSWLVILIGEERENGMFFFFFLAVLFAS